MLKKKSSPRVGNSQAYPEAAPQPDGEDRDFGGKVSVGNPCVHDELVPGKAKQRDRPMSDKESPLGLKEDKLPEPGKSEALLSLIL